MSEKNFDIPAGLLQALRSAQRVVALTGAGVSAESGIPTFREAQTGLWSQYAPTELASPEAFERNPKLVWDWYEMRRQTVAAAQPNPGHYALAALEQRYPQFTLITQNVDGLHRRAGSQLVLELHGNIERIKCSQEGSLISSWAAGQEEAPRCPDCGAYLRPDVVWFGESLPEHALNAAWEAAGSCEIFFSIGTSSLVEPAASLPYVALDAGALLVEINPQETPLTRWAAYSLQASSGAALPALVSQLIR